ncbi:hypothetical protein [Rhodococcus sp. IEGM 1379]|nr:hypothetical protein [Rhodococcus sp. IEGM 1379]
MPGDLAVVMAVWDSSRQSRVLGCDQPGRDEESVARVEAKAVNNCS